MSTEHLKHLFHKDNSTLNATVENNKVIFMTRSIQAFNNTLPIEVLHLFKCYKHVVIQMTTWYQQSYLEFTGNNNGEGISASYKHHPDFWAALIDVINNTHGEAKISEELKTYYKTPEDLYTMEQVVHLVNVIRGDLANQPKLLKQILNMEIEPK